MCNFFSAIITKDGILYDPQIDSHEDLIKKAKLDDSTMKPDFVRVEMTPNDKDIFNHDLSNCQFNVVQDLLPDWWNDEFEKIAIERTQIALKKVFDKIFFVGKKDIKINDGRIFVKNSEVDALDQSEVHAFGQSKVDAYGQSKVYAYDQSNVHAYGQSKVHAYGQSKVHAYGQSKVHAYGQSEVDAYSSSIEIINVTQYAIVRCFFEDKPKLIIANNSLEIVEFKNA